jgi:hypothetical protein
MAYKASKTHDCCLAETTGYYYWWMLVAGKGLGEDVRNGAAARPVVAAREGRPREERVRDILNRSTRSG